MKLSVFWSRRRPFTFESVISECLSNEEAERLKRLPLTGLDVIGQQQRIALFATAVGVDKARFVNERLETKVLLPHQKAGLLAWLKSERGVAPKWREEIKREIESLDHYLSGDELERFMERLAKLRLGVGVTFAEAAEITRLSQKVQLAKAGMEAGGSAETYELARSAFHVYVEKLKSQS